MRAGRSMRRGTGGRGSARAAAQVQSQAPVSGDTAQGQCVIKGNISSKGERIYHVPGGRYYDATVIDTAKCERWFCT